MLKNDLKNLYSHISHGDLIEYYIEKYNKKYPEVKIICSDAEGISEKEKGNALLRKGFISKISIRSYKSIEEKKEVIDKYFENLENGSTVSLTELASECKIAPNFFSSLKKIPVLYEEIREENSDRLPSLDELKNGLKNDLKTNYAQISQDGVIEYYIEKYNKIFPTGKIICSDAEGISEKEKVRALREGFISPLITRIKTKTDKEILIEKKKVCIDKYFENIGNGSKVNQSELARQCKLDYHFFTELKHIPKVYKEMKEELKDRLPSLDELKARLKEDLKSNYYRISQGDLIEYYIEKYNEKNPYNKIILSE